MLVKVFGHFSWTSAFRKVLDNVELITCKQISENFNDWMQRYGQKNAPKWGFPPFVTPQFFFNNSNLNNFKATCYNFISTDLVIKSILSLFN